MLIYAHSRGGAVIAGLAAPAQLVPAALLAPVFAAVVEVTSQPGTALTVSNTGPCVPAAQVPALCEPFRRLTADRTGHGGGAAWACPSSVRSPPRIAARSGPAPARGRPDRGDPPAVGALPAGH